MIIQIFLHHAGSSQNKTRKHKTNQKEKENKQTKQQKNNNNNKKLAFTIQKFFEVYLWENCLLCSHGEVNWQSLTS